MERREECELNGDRKEAVERQHGSDGRGLRRHDIRSNKRGVAAAGPTEKPSPPFPKGVYSLWRLLSALSRYPLREYLPQSPDGVMANRDECQGRVRCENAADDWRRDDFLHSWSLCVPGCSCGVDRALRVKSRLIGHAQISFSLQQIVVLLLSALQGLR